MLIYFLLSMRWVFSLGYKKRQNQGINLVLKYIPKEVFDKKAVARGDIKFHDVAFIDVKTNLKNNFLSLELIKLQCLLHTKA